MAEKEIILQGEDGQVDELVLTTQDQASCDSLEECVRMLFPQEGEKKPRLRFKGFEGDWVTTKLSQISRKVTTKNTDLKYRATLTNSAERGIVNQRDYFDHDVSNGDNIQGYYVVENDDFVYNPRISTIAPVGPINRNQLGYTGVMSPLYYVFRVDGIDKDYLSYYFKTTLWHKFMYENGNSGARFDRFSISYDVFEQMPIIHPKNIDEQRKIASFLQRLDEQVKHYQEQFDELKHLKSACLNEMFPQQNESVPSVRFSGFEGDWEIVSFKDITRLAGVRNRENLPLESYSISNENGFVPQNEQFENGGTMSKADKRLYYIVSPNSFAYNPARINVGSIGYDDLDKDVIVSSLYVVFKTDEKTYNPFLNYWFKTPTFRKLIEQYQEGGVRLYFFYDKLCKCSFRRPSFDEQRQIATFFSELDKQISAQQEQLERLKQMKQSCLGLLFPDNQSITPPPQIQGI